MSAPVQPSERRPRFLRHEEPGYFRVLVGVHFGDGPPGCDCDACATSNGKNHVYRARRAFATKDQPADPEDYAGDVLYSEQDLERRCNQGSFSRKFERIPPWQMESFAARGIALPGLQLHPARTEPVAPVNAGAAAGAAASTPGNAPAGQKPPPPSSQQQPSRKG